MSDNARKILGICIAVFFGAVAGTTPIMMAIGALVAFSLLALVALSPDKGNSSRSLQVGIFVGILIATFVLVIFGIPLGHTMFNGLLGASVGSIFIRMFGKRPPKKDE
jgi:uncharacterized membrane protein YgaE (UPF0421/DUF939 family)